MRFSVVALSIILLLASPAWADGNSNSRTLANKKEKESYSIGYQVGLSINNDAVEIDFNALIKGLQDGVAKKDPLLNVEEMKSLILALKAKARDEALRKVQELRVKNAGESEKFLAENAVKEGVKTTESGLQYRILREGKGESPQLEDYVKVHYRGIFPDGTEFDNSYKKGEPQIFQTDGVIKGWTEALQMMKVGSQWEIYVPPNLAYGRGGLGLKIPPNQVLVFQMELLAIEKDDNKS